MKAVPVRVFLLAAVLFLCAGTASFGAITGVTGGTAAPAATLGPYTMTPFPDDPRAEFDVVTGVPSPLGGVVGFAPALSLRTIGSGWATWSHGYGGDVYAESTTIALTMPADTGAFYLYAEPEPFAVHTITAIAQDGTSISQDVDGLGGASYYGFYATGGDTIASIVMTSATTSFAIGEFGIALVPEPTSIALLACGGLGLAAFAVRRRVRR